MKKGGKADNALNVPSEHRDDDEMIQLLNSDDVDKLRSILHDSEVVHSIVLCKCDDSDSVVAATSERLLFCDQRFISSKTVSLQYPDVAAAIYNPEMIFLEITLVHMGGSLHITNVDKEHGKRFIEYLKDIIGDNYTAHGTNGRVLEYTNDLVYSEDIATSE